MPVYIVTGKLGSGKTLSMVARLRTYIEEGKRVATNVDLDIRKLVRKKPKEQVIRLPDRPSVEDLVALGAVHSTGREELNGALVLDECGTWMNARSWNDKSRSSLIDWFLHTRKLGWDVFLIVQNLSLVDKQIRDALAEYHVICRRLDRIKIPLIGTLGKALTAGLWNGTFPAVHMAMVRYGVGAQSIHADTWVYKGKDLYGAYQTVQQISEESAGTYCQFWYCTDAERAAWPKLPKPKLPAVKLASGLPRADAWRWAKRYATALDNATQAVQA